MLVIINFNIEKELKFLENNISKLRLLHHSLIFQMIISDSIKLMLLISQLIKNKNNLFRKKFIINY